VTVLRDAALSSRLLILLELRRRPAPTLAPLAKAVGLTPQAVSQYMKHLEQEGLVRRQDEVWRTTEAGEAFLATRFQELKQFADRAVRELVSVESCVAIAGAPVRKGARVGLFMVGGRLVAFPNRKSPSWGIARADAPLSRDVLVEDLQGIVEIPAASLTIIEAPGGSEGGSASVDGDWLRTFMASIDGAALGALDEIGEGILQGTGSPWRFEFAPLESTTAAVSRGVSPLLVGGPESVARLVAAIEAAKADGKLRGFAYQVIRAKRGASREARPRKAG
jgi:putative transcriptional regulator